jgi:hypothetical protein
LSFLLRLSYEGQDEGQEMGDGEEILNVGFWILDFGFSQLATCNPELRKAK